MSSKAGTILNLISIHSLYTFKWQLFMKSKMFDFIIKLSLKILVVSQLIIKYCILRLD